MEEYPIRVGSALFTLVEPRRGHEVAYNRWYERDHFYAGCMIGPGNFAGRRGVAARRHKALPVAPAGHPVPRAEGGDTRRMVLWFIDRDPAEGWADTFGSHGDALAASGAGRVLWAAPFIPTVPGTDTYTDQLW